jgi:RNA polymerase primary sigma factor
MARLVLMQARNAGVGQRMRQAMEDYRSVDERLLSDLGRNPTLSEIATELHMTEDEAATVAKMLDAARVLAQAKQPAQAEETEEDNQAVEDTAYFQMRQRISELLSHLDEEGARLLTLRFGLEGGKPLSPEETGRKLGLTPEEVIAKETKVLAKLRNI